jgi:hypothetical protein
VLPAEVFPSDDDRVGREGPKKSCRRRTGGLFATGRCLLKNATCGSSIAPRRMLASVRRLIAWWLSRASLSHRPSLLDGVASVSAGFFLRPVVQLVRTLRA